MNLVNSFIREDFQKNIKKSVAQDEWTEKVTCSDTRKQAVDVLILEFFISEGYFKAAQQFALESGLEIDLALNKSMQQKNDLREMLYKGDIEELIDYLIDIDVNIFANSQELLVDLLLIKFANLVKNGELKASIDFAKQKLAQYMTNEEFAQRIDKYLIMLSFQDISKYPYQDQINNDQLCRITQNINQLLNQRKDPKLIMLLKLFCWSQDILFPHMNFPILEDPSEGKIDIKFKEKLDVQRADHTPVVLSGDDLNNQTIDNEEDIVESIQDNELSDVD